MSPLSSRDCLIKTVLHENLEKRVIYAGLAVLSDLTAAVAVAVGMWKPASFAGFQAPRASRTVVADVPSFRPRSAISTARPGLSAILARICCLGGRRSGNRCLSESRVECTFLQILAQSHKNRTRRELLFHTIDSDRIAASGHSIGGYATYALAGGDKLVCDALWPVVYGQDTLPYPPSTCVPTLPDDRIKTMISLDGSSQMMRYRELARISMPSLIMGETVENSESLGELAPCGGRASNEGLDRTSARGNRPRRFLSRGCQWCQSLFIYKLL